MLYDSAVDDILFEIIFNLIIFLIKIIFNNCFYLFIINTTTRIDVLIIPPTPIKMSHNGMSGLTGQFCMFVTPFKWPVEIIRQIMNLK